MRIEVTFSKYKDPCVFGDLITLARNIECIIAMEKDRENDLIGPMAEKIKMEQLESTEYQTMVNSCQAEINCLSLMNKQRNNALEVNARLTQIATFQQYVIMHQRSQKLCQDVIEVYTKRISEHEQLRDQYQLSISDLKLSGASSESLDSLGDLLKISPISGGGLSITDSTIGANTATIIKGLLESNSLTYLSLKGSNISYENATIIADGLSANTSLKTLNLDGIEATPDAIRLLDQARSRSTSSPEPHLGAAASVAVGRYPRFDFGDASRELPENLVHETIKND